MGSINVFLYGGLGNQMFQYAFARKLALEHNLNLNLNLHGFNIDNYFQRKFDLKNFDISYQNIVYGDGLRFNLCRLMQHYPNQSQLVRSLFSSLIVEKTNNVQYNKITLSNQQSNFYLYGYWQDELYFNDIKNYIVNDFSLIKEFSPDNNKIREIIKDNNNYIAVHARMLHMVKTSAKNDFDVNKNLNYRVKSNYYSEALKYINDRVENPVFYVFSDKPKDAKTYFQELNYQFVFLDNSRGEDFEDLSLMSKFQHHIIANSSFSWWGAWLGQKTEQIVIAPKETLFTPNIPPNWTQL